MKLTFNRDGIASFDLDTDQLPQASKDYLWQYGFAQSLQDCIAGREKKVRAECVEKGLNADETNAAVVADLAGQLGKRFDAIMAGAMHVGASGGDPLTALAKEMLRATLKKMGAKVSKEKFAELVGGILSDPAKRAKVQAEYDRRAADDLGVEIDDAE